MYVADTHAWVAYLLNNLPKKVEAIFSSVEQYDDVMFVPSIVLNECIYLIDSGKLRMDKKELTSNFEESNNFLIYPLDLEITKIVANIRGITELHDRIIVATAIFLNSILMMCTYTPPHECGGFPMCTASRKPLCHIIPT